MGWIFLFLGAIFIVMTMISNVENRKIELKHICLIQIFYEEPFNFLVHFSIQKSYNFFEFVV